MKAPDHNRMLQLQRSLRNVSRRVFARQFWWLVFVLGVAVCVFGGLLMGATQSGAISPTAGWVTFLVAAVAALLVSFRQANARRRDTGWIAQQIEQRFPTLNQRLFTTLSLTDSQTQSYLGQQLIEETRQHDRSNRWDRIVSSGSILMARILGSAAIVATVWMGVLISRSGPPTVVTAVPSIPVSAAEVEITVEPGNTELERGSSLVVTARFSHLIPEEATLICLEQDGTERRFVMRQNLDDPVLGGFIPPIDQPLAYRVETKDWTSENFEVNVFEFPTLVRSDAVLDFPDYTQMPDKRIEDTIRVSAVEGSRVTWQCFLNKDVESSVLVSEDGQRIEMSPSADDSGAFEAAIDLAKTERFTLELIDDAGRKNKFPPKLVARVLPNQPPKLKLTKARDFSVSPIEEVTLTATARDDFGIQKVGLAYTFDEQAEKEIVLGEDISKGASEELSHLLEFESLRAEPDQLLAYHFWAEDIGPDGKSRRVQSDLFFAEVRPFEEIFLPGEAPPSSAQSQPPGGGAAQQAQKLAELQKEIMTATWNVIRRESAEVVSEMFVEDVAVIADSQRSAIEQLTELMAELSDASSKEIAAGVAESMGRAAELLDAAVAGKDKGELLTAMNAERRSYAGLLKLRAHEFQVSKSQRKPQQSRSGSASSAKRQQQVDDLELEQDENRYETNEEAQQNAEQDPQQAEQRQVLSRLRELARRAEDMNKELAKLQSALEQAESEEEEEEIRRQLKRLREQQQDLLRQTDELAERMMSPENQETMSEESEKLEQTRENLRKASEALRQEDASTALSAGKRAERDFEELRDEFRRRTAGQFNDEMREMRNDAQELDETQKELTEQLEKRQDSKERSPGLRRDQEESKIEDQLREERGKLNDLLEQMQKTVEEAEAAEPLLAQKLYDTYRRTRQQRIERRMEASAQFLEEGYQEQGTEFQKEAARGISELRENLEEAAESVLGDDTEGLKRATERLERLSDELDQELDREAPGTREEERQGRGQGRPGEQEAENQNASDSEGQESQGRNGQGQSRDQQEREGDPQGRSSENSEGEPNDNAGKPQGESNPGGKGSGERREENSPSQPQDANQQGEPQSGQNPSGGQPGNAPSEPGSQSQQEGSASPQSGSPSEGQGGNQPRQRAGLRPSPNEARRPTGQPRDGQPRDGQPRESQGQEGNQPGGRFAADSPGNSPFTGDFRSWSDELRDVEEMVGDPELRSRAAQIRDRARQMRSEIERHSKMPQWELVEDLIAQPLRELRRDVQREYMRRAAEKNALVPIDRDPVPDQYTEAVQQYYENLGSGQ